MSAKDLTEALDKLMKAGANAPAEAPSMKARGAAPEVKASALLGGSGSGGIASPLVETAYANRTFHSTVNITSTDGLFTLKIKPVKEIKFLDSNLRPVTIEFKSP